MIKSADEFVKLRVSEDPEEYGRAATEEAHEEVWMDVIKNHPEMKEWVALNKTVPLSILRILSSDEDEKVRFTVAMKRKLDRDLFEKLSRDQSSSVRESIAYNQKTPIDVIERLAFDDVDRVRKVAQKRLNR